MQHQKPLHRVQRRLDGGKNGNWPSTWVPIITKSTEHRPPDHPWNHSKLKASHLFHVMFLLSTCSSSYWDKNQGSLGIRWYHWNHECNLHTELEKRRKNSIIQNSSSAGRISVLLNVKAKPNPSKSNNIHRSNIIVNFTIAALLLQIKCLPSPADVIFCAPYPHSWAVAGSTGSLAHTPGLRCHLGCSLNRSWTSPALPRRNRSRGAGR